MGLRHLGLYGMGLDAGVRGLGQLRVQDAP